MASPSSNSPMAEVRFRKVEAEPPTQAVAAPTGKAGAKKPAKKTKVSEDEGVCNEVEAPQEFFLPFSLHKLSQQVVRGMGAHETQEWHSFQEQVRILVSEYAESKFQDMKSDLLGYTPAENPVQRSVRCTAALNELFQSAEFMPVSESNFSSALRSFFLFDLPVIFDWRSMDPESFEQCFGLKPLERSAPGNLSPRPREVCNPYAELAKRGKGTADVPPFARRLLMYTRGMSSTTSKGLFIEQKLDWLVLKLFKRIGTFAPFIFQALFPTLVMDEKHKLPLEAPHHSVRVVDADEPLPPPAVHPSDQQTVFHRRTLANILKEKGFLATFFKEVTIEEPVYKDVVLVSVKRDPEFLKSAKIDQNKMEDQSSLQMQLFKDVPYSDLDALLPIKTVKIKPLHMIFFVIQVLTGIWLIYTAAMAYKDITETGLLLFLGGFIAAVGQQLYGLFYALQVQQQTYHDQLRTWLDSKRVCSNLEVINTLTEEVKDQNLKEILLSYFLLSKMGEMTLKELDICCEEFVRAQFDLKLDFDVHGSLESLQNLQLVREIQYHGGEPRYQVAVTPREYLERYPLSSFFRELRLKRD